MDLLLAYGFVGLAATARCTAGFAAQHQGGVRAKDKNRGSRRVQPQRQVAHDLSRRLRSSDRNTHAKVKPITAERDEPHVELPDILVAGDHHGDW